MYNVLTSYALIIMALGASLSQSDPIVGPFSGDNSADVSSNCKDCFQAVFKDERTCALCELELLEELDVRRHDNADSGMLRKRGGLVGYTRQSRMRNACSLCTVFRNAASPYCRKCHGK